MCSGIATFDLYSNEVISQTYLSLSRIDKNDPQTSQTLNFLFTSTPTEKIDIYSEKKHIMHKFEPVLCSKALRCSEIRFKIVSFS